MKDPKKPFDAIEYKRQAQLRIHEETRGKGHAEILSYFREKADRSLLGDWWKGILSSKRSEDSIEPSKKKPRQG